MICSCSRKIPEGDLTHIPYRPQPVTLNEPAHFVKMVNPEDNPMTQAGIELGRKLFFDPILSADSTVSCASCHHPEVSFSDGLDFSVGIGGQTNLRSSLPLVNVGYYYKGLFWDGRSPSLEAQALDPVTNPLEMGHDWQTTPAAIAGTPGIPDLLPGSIWYFRP